MFRIFLVVATGRRRGRPVIGIPGDWCFPSSRRPLCYTKEKRDDLKLPPFNRVDILFRNHSTFRLIATTAFFKLCGETPVVNAFKSVLVSKNIIVRECARTIVRLSVLPLFSPGSHFEDCSRLSRHLHVNERITSVVDASSEELEEESAFEHNVLEKLKLIAQIRHSMQDHKPIVVSIPLKCTSLIDSRVLESMTSYLNAFAHERGRPVSDVTDFQRTLSELSVMDRDQYDSGMNRFRRILEAAADNKIAVLLDAEQSHRQPAIEGIALTLSAEYNTVRPPVLYNTYQLYLKRTQAALDRDLLAAKEGKYIFAAKVVRGAYVTSERSMASSASASTVWPSKLDVDVAYDAAVCGLLDHIAVETEGPQTLTPWVLVATHNRESVEKAVSKMSELGIACHDPRVQFAQILGMSDHITIGLAQGGYNASKLILFGSLESLLPWFMKRLDENNDAFGAMQRDRHLYMEEVVRRLKGTSA